VTRKHYDEQYFERWYRREGFGSRARLQRKVHYALSAAEYLLERPVRTVLDVGCGEAPWRAALHRVRPTISYVGVDPSDYAVARFGRTRDIRLGTFGGLRELGLRGPFDLVVCADVVLYVNDRDLRRGLETISDMLRGVAYIEIFTANDEIEGDLSQFHRRRPSTYERVFASVGLARVGPHLYAGTEVLPTLSDFEGPSGLQSGKQGPSGLQSGKQGPSGLQSGKQGPSGLQSGKQGGWRD
jgi:SAM-dependent methyltransferase